MQNLTIKITENIIAFPLIEALTQIVKKAEKLSSLQIEMDLSTNNLSLITSALHQCKNFDTLKLFNVSNGPTGYKYLQNLVKSGKLKTLEFHSKPMRLFAYPTIGEDAESINEYVYEDEDLISEETKLKKLKPLLKKIVLSASFHEKEVSPVEILDGCLHPCVRFQNVYPVPICSNFRNGQHYICQSLASIHSMVSSLTVEVSDPRDLICLGDSLTSNISLKTLKIAAKESFNDLSKSTKIHFTFPLFFGVSCHLGLTELDLSEIYAELDSEALELAFSAFNSHTAQSLKKVNLRK